MGEVVWISFDDNLCAGCSKELHAGDLVVMSRETGIRCLACAGLADLLFLESGNVALTRRAARLSSRHAVVVKFVRRRNRNERQGTLVEEAALREAERLCAQDAAQREAKAAKRREKDAIADREYVERFRVRILEIFPRCPPEDAATIAKHACAKYSGRVGRTSWAKELEPRAIELAVQAHIRHTRTEYDEVIDGTGKPLARELVGSRVREILESWR